MLIVSMDTQDTLWIRPYQCTTDIESVKMQQRHKLVLQTSSYYNVEV